MIHDSKKHLEVALTLAQEASQYILASLRQPIRTEWKADHSPVTEVDLHVDELIREGLARAFPRHGILTEEHGLTLGSEADFLWVVDPLDGTRAFANKLPGFSVMIALLHQGVPCLGVVADPLEGHIYEALRGEGAFHRWHGKRERLKVSSRDYFGDMPLVISTGLPEEVLQAFVEHFGVPCLPPINSVGIKVGFLVRQAADLYFNHHSVHYWDTGAPQMILEEAGGKMTKLDGSALGYSLDGRYDHGLPTLATNGVRHGEVLEFLQGLLKSSDRISIS